MDIKQLEAVWASDVRSMPLLWEFAKRRRASHTLVCSPTSLSGRSSTRKVLFG